MDFVIDNILIIYILPFVFAAFCFALHFIKIDAPKKLLAVISMAISAIQAVFAGILFYLCNFTAFETPDISAEWFRFADSAVFFGVFIDNISVLFLLIFSLVILAVHWYSASYEKIDKDIPLFFGCTNFINFALIVLVLSSNALQSLIFISLVSAFSYLLLNMNFAKLNVSSAAEKYIFVNRIADAFLALGFVILIYFVLNYPISEGRELLAYSSLHEIVADFYIYLSDEGFLLTCVLFFIGILFKSALFPVHFVFEKISKSVSNLAAIVVFSVSSICGIYLTVRLLPLFSLSATGMNCLICVGAVSAFVCAVFAAANNKPDKIIAYAFASQTATVLALLGFSALSQGILYFCNSLISLAVLLLVSGLYTNKAKNSESLGIPVKEHPLVFLSALVAVLAQVGLFFGGFFADNSIFQVVLDGQNVIFILLFVLTALLTSFYLFKVLFTLFTENPKDNENAVCPNAAQILSIMFLSFGFICVSCGLLFGNYYSSMFNFKSLITTIYFVLLLIFGVAFAFLAVFKFGNSKKTVLGNFLRKGFYFDKLFEILSDNVFDVVTNIAKNFDKYVINSIVNSFGYVKKFCSYCVSVSQNGNIQSYIAYSLFAIGILLIFYVAVAIGIGGSF